MDGAAGQGWQSQSRSGTSRWQVSSHNIVAALRGDRTPTRHRGALHATLYAHGQAELASCELHLEVQSMAPFCAYSNSQQEHLLKADNNPGCFATACETLTTAGMMCSTKGAA